MSKITTTKEKLLEIAKDIREVIAKKQEELELSFIEDTHIYFMRDLNGVVRNNYPSVSTVIKQFYEGFPDLEKSLEMCNGDVIEQDKLLTQWRATADYANSKGSRTHFLLETDLLKQYGSYKSVREPIFDCDTDQIRDSNAMIDAGHKFIQLMHRRGAVLLDTEMVLGSPELGYTGQPDKVWIMFNEEGELGLICTDWKGLPLDTPIFTNSGWKTMGTLTTLDKVYDKDGDLVNIKNISTIKKKKCLKIVFDNNEEIISDFEHRWLVFTEHMGIKKEMVMTTQEIKDYLDKLPKRYQYKLLKVDIAKPLNNPEIELPLDPYLFGVWLGDGHSVDNKVTQANEAVWDEIKRRGYKVGNDVSQGGSGKASTRTIHGIRHVLFELNVIKNKHVPDIFLMGSYEQRLDLLRGLMDSDGTLNKARNRFYVSTTRLGQVEFATKIISSLGLKSTVIKYDKKFNGKIIKCYNIEFSCTKFNPFLCRNQHLKIEELLVGNKRTYKVIKTVEEVDTLPTKCIEVDSPTSTFLYGHTFSVTHNTNKQKNFEVHSYTQPMLEPFDDYMDTALTHYQIQLPLYIRLLLDMLKGTKYDDIKLFGAIIVHLTDNSKFFEYRIPKNFINTVLTMDPLIRIDEVMKNKKEHANKEENRKKLLSEALSK